ncbi:hypothetical protein BVX98_02455, partial [bacterium F11]
MYYIRVQATDNVLDTGNSEPLVSLASATFVYDIQHPTATIAVPVNNEYYNGSSQPLPSISGAALDEGLISRVDSVVFSIRETGTGLYWDYNASTFNSAGELFNNMNFIAGPDVWASTRPALTDGYNYELRLQATDLATNAQPLGSFTNFTYDISSPTTRITLPVDGAKLISLPTISGTVSDSIGLGGIETVELAIRVDTGTWYSGVSETFDAGGETFFTAKTTNSYQTWFATGIPFVSGHEYWVKSRSTDKATNEEDNFVVSVNTITFTFDSDKPESRVTFPDGTEVRSTISQITGTASDGKAGVDRVYVSVGQLVGLTTSYFNGAGFNAATEYFNLTNWSGSDPWTYNTAIPYASGLKYMLRSYAVDEAGNVETALPAQIEVYYDVTKPTTTIYEPGQASFISAMSQVKGTAYDKTAEVESLLA